VHVRPATFQQRDELFAQRLIVISLFAFLFVVRLFFFSSRGFPISPKEAAVAANPEPNAASFSRTRHS